MAKQRTRMLPIISVPVEQDLKNRLLEEAKRDDRSLSDTCRRLWRDALAARNESRELATSAK